MADDPLVKLFRGIRSSTTHTNIGEAQTCTRAGNTAVGNPRTGALSGKLWVKKIGNHAPIQANINASVNDSAVGAWVFVGENIQTKELDVIGINWSKNVRSFGAGVAAALSLPRVPGQYAQSEVIGRAFAPGNMSPSEAGGLNVYIKPFHYDDDWWAGGNFELTPPATSDKKAWCAVFIDSATNTAVQILGDDHGLADTMTEAQIASEINVPDGYIPVGAVVLRNGQTSVTTSDTFADFRYHFMTKGSGSGTLDSVVAGEAITVDVTDPANPIVAVDINGLSEIASIDPAADFIPIYDASSGGIEKVNPNDLVVAAGGNNTSIDTFANRPSTPATGDQFIPTDGFYQQFYSGSAWKHFIPPAQLLTPPPTTGSWTGDNAGSATFTDEYDTLFFESDTGGNLNVQYMAAPATPWTKSFALIPYKAFQNFSVCGLVFRQSSDGKLRTFTITHDTGTSGFLVQAQNWTSTTVFGATLTQNQLYTAMIGAPLFMRIADDGANRLFQLSLDFRVWRTFFSEGRTTTMTADQFGIVVRSGTSGSKGALRVLALE
jgi:hypothetical protein